MQIKFSIELSTVLGYASDEAMQTGHRAAGADHLMLGLLRHRENDACKTLEALGADLRQMKEAIDREVFTGQEVAYQERDGIHPSKPALRTVSTAVYEALKTGITEVGPAHLLLALSRTTGTATRNELESLGIDYDRIRAYMCGKGILLRMEETVPVHTEEILGALGEQLTSLFGSVRDKTNYYS